MALVTYTIQNTSSSVFPVGADVLLGKALKSFQVEQGGKEETQINTLLSGNASLVLVSVVDNVTSQVATELTQQEIAALAIVGSADVVDV